MEDYEKFLTCAKIKQKPSKRKAQSALTCFRQDDKVIFKTLLQERVTNLDKMKSMCYLAMLEKINSARRKGIGLTRGDIEARIVYVLKNLKVSKETEMDALKMWYLNQGYQLVDLENSESEQKRDCTKAFGHPEILSGEETESTQNKNACSTVNKAQELVTFPGIFTVTWGFGKSSLKFFFINYHQNSCTKVQKRALLKLVLVEGGRILQNEDEMDPRGDTFVISVGNYSKEVEEFYQRHHIDVYHPSVITQAVMNGVFEPSRRHKCLDHLESVTSGCAVPDHFACPNVYEPPKRIYQHITSVKVSIGSQTETLNPSDNMDDNDIIRSAFSPTVGIVEEPSKDIQLVNTYESGCQTEVSVSNMDTVTFTEAVNGDVGNNNISGSSFPMSCDIFSVVALAFTNVDQFRPMSTIVKLALLYNTTQPTFETLDGLWKLALLDVDFRTNALDYNVKDKYKYPSIIKKKLIKFVTDRCNEQMELENFTIQSKEVWPSFVTDTFLSLFKC